MYVGTNIIILFYLHPSLIIVSEKQTHTFLIFDGSRSTGWINKENLNFFFRVLKIYTHVFRQTRGIKIIWLLALFCYLTAHQQTQIAQKVTEYFIIRTVIVSYFFGANKATTAAHRKWTESILFYPCAFFCFTWYIQFFLTSSRLKPSIETLSLWNCERRPIIKWEQPLFYIHVSHFRSKFMAVFFTLSRLRATKKWLPNQFPLDIEQLLLLCNVTKNGNSINFFIACSKYLIMLAGSSLHYHFISVFSWSMDLNCFSLYPS